MGSLGHRTPTATHLKVAQAAPKSGGDVLTQAQTSSDDCITIVTG
ncbi:MAG: hypothetical protein ACI855_001870 [Myxococcota bacterium]|jgi:hypothetical protein